MSFVDRFDHDGFFLSTNLETGLLPYRKFNLSAMSQWTRDGLKSSASCLVLDTEHQLDLLLSTQSGTVNMTVSSSLLARNPLSLVIKGSRYCTGAHLNREHIESNLLVPGIQGCHDHETALCKSFQMSAHLI